MSCILNTAFFLLVQFELFVFWFLNGNDFFHFFLLLLVLIKVPVQSKDKYSFFSRNNTYIHFILSQYVVSMFVLYKIDEHKLNCMQFCAVFVLANILRGSWLFAYDLVFLSFAFQQFFCSIFLQQFTIY